MRKHIACTAILAAPTVALAPGMAYAAPEPTNKTVKEAQISAEGSADPVREVSLGDNVEVAPGVELTPEREVQHLKATQGEFQMFSVLETANSPRPQYRLVSEDSRFVAGKDGTVKVERDGKPVATLDKPWAVDASGQPVQTSFTVKSESTLVQNVLTTSDTEFPVTADPKVKVKWHWGGPNIHIKYSRSESDRLVKMGLDSYISALKDDACDLAQVGSSACRWAVDKLAFSTWESAVKKSRKNSNQCISAKVEVTKPKTTMSTYDC